MIRPIRRGTIVPPPWVCQGMLNPERAILIESSDTVLWRNELRARLISGDSDKVEDRLFRGAFVP